MIDTKKFEIINLILFFLILTIYVITNNPIFGYLGATSLGVALFHRAHEEGLKFSFILISISLLIRYLYFKAQGIHPGGDSDLYHTMASQVVDQGMNWYPPNQFINLCAIIYKVFGKSLENILIFNIFLGLFSSNALIKIIQSFKLKNISDRCIYYSCYLFPPLIFISANPFKEQIILLLITMILYGFQFKKYTLTITSLIGLYIFRSPFFLILILPFFILNSLSILKFGTLKEIKVRKLKFFTFLFGVIFLLPVLIYQIPEIKRLVNEDIYNRLFPDDYATLLHSDVSHRPALHKLINKDSPYSLKNLIITPIRSIFSPNPLRFYKNITDYQLPFEPLVLIESIFLTSWIYFLFPFFIIGHLNNWKGRIHLKLINLSFYWLIFLIASLTALTKSPQTFRYRWSLFGIFLIAGMIGLNDYIDRKKWTKAITFSWYALALLFTGIYLFVI